MPLRKWALLIIRELPQSQRQCQRRHPLGSLLALLNATSWSKRWSVISMYLGMATSLKVALSSGGQGVSAPYRCAL
jgi:hypothetical protein